MHFHIITLFPDVCQSYCNFSIIGRALREKKFRVSYYNPIDYSDTESKRVDDRPYGGGPGMVLEALPVLRAYEKARGRKKNVETFFLSPSGEQFSASVVGEIFKKKTRHIILICGRYEGIDARVRLITNARALAVGNLTLTGGELPALFIIDSIIRKTDGVLGNDQSIEEKRVASSDVYTRPALFTYKGKKWSVPEILLSGNHPRIEKWRKQK